ncbi:MAG: imidazole glycerol phosphate synthase subunit HisH [Deltaproteobacteria bacterium]|nr:imidazole glycerol phosphate synthase subunit HisH [Deltaproteobacteria bacterium]
MSREVWIIPTGTANVASIVAGLSRAGARACLSENPREIEAAPFAVLPGVGAFGAAMERLGSNGLGAVVVSRIRSGAPTLCVCLGLQLLFEASEESPAVRGLGVVQGTVGRFSGNVRVPQFGWNKVEPDSECRLIAPGHAYFANSYRVTSVPGGFAAAFADHGGRFVAAFERGGLLACQFHPELSGELGIALIRRWIDACG